jgi:hypothetical protein
MKQCPRCKSRNITRGVCMHCNFKDQRRVHTMLPPGKERRTNKPTSGWDNVVIPGERRW